MKKSLTKKLEDALNTIEHKQATIDAYYDRFTKAERELERIREDRMMGLQRFSDAHEIEIKHLLEIIRWQIKPDTAKDPWNEIERQKNKQY
jgi:hypothetical protein